MIRKSLAITAFGILASVQYSYAHHSHAMFDTGKSPVLLGTIDAVQFSNPHVYVKVEVSMIDGVPVAGGGTESWTLEFTAGPGRLSAAGMPRESFPEGGEIEIQVNPLRSGEKGAAYMHMVSLNGVKNVAPADTYTFPAFEAAAAPAAAQ